MEEKKRLFTHVDSTDKVKKDGEDILYLLLVQGDPKYEDANEFRDWLFITGRQAAYDYIVNLLENDHEADYDNFINIEESMIYADNPHIPESQNKLKLSNGFSFYQFIKDATVLKKVDIKEGFDIEEFRQQNLEDIYDDEHMAEDDATGDEVDEE